ncbi:hypothetical protein NIB75_21510 [Bacteroides uniformis]|nr:hypothetical protein [Bacteroides uniformis]
MSDSLKIGIADDGDYLQRQLLAIHEELRKRLNNTPYTHIQRNVTGYGVGLHCIDLDLMVNTPERQKEFREKIMDSPVFCFHGVEVPVINERVSRNHIRGIHIRPEYPVFSTKALHATFILSNHSGGDLTCGEHYYPDVRRRKRYLAGIADKRCLLGHRLCAAGWGGKGYESLPLSGCASQQAGTLPLLL